MAAIVLAISYSPLVVVLASVSSTAQLAVEALVVSDETSNQGTILNELRAKRNLPPVQVVTVPMFLAKDGTRISTTRIKNSEIDIDGNLLSIDK